MKLFKSVRRSFYATLAMVLLAGFSNAAIIVQTNDDWKAIEFSSASAGWNTDVNFDDSSWANAMEVYPVGPPNSDPNTFGIWDQSGLENGNNGIAARQTFNVSGTVTSALINGAFDDDGLVYINGTLVYSDNNGSANNYNFDVSSYLVQGTNLIAIQGINVQAPFHSAWLEIDAEVAAVPEPSSVSLLALSGLFLLRRRKSAEEII